MFFTFDVLMYLLSIHIEYIMLFQFLPQIFPPASPIQSTLALLFYHPSPYEGSRVNSHPCCITKEQKRECQTPPSRSLSHSSPHHHSRWGCLFLFSKVPLNPKSPPKWMCPHPASHFQSSAAHHPPARSPRGPCPKHA